MVRASTYTCAASPRHQQQLSSSDKEELEEDEEEEFPISSPLSVPGLEQSRENQHNPHSLSIMAALVAALRKSLVVCSVGAEEDGGGLGYRRASPSSMEIGWPTDVRHVAHVTFDRFGGFLGLPVELELEVPRRVPSASTSVFGVSAESMQCSYDNRGNSVPTILLSMQRHLYSEGGLQMEGIFRINAEDGKEVFIRDELNRGTVPHGVDLHCLAGLIKAWFRELPRGVLDSLTPDQVMRCNTEEACSELIRTLPPTEAALLDWAANLMADVVEHEHYNKMNVRNIAMVFAPNMTQMADPLTALIHAVQVMNLLRTLISKTLRERQEASFTTEAVNSCSESPNKIDEPISSKPSEKYSLSTDSDTLNVYDLDKVAIGKFLLNAKESLGLSEDRFGSFEKKSQIDEQYEFISTTISTFDDAVKDECKCEFVYGNVESAMERLSFREGMRKFCRHPVFQLSRITKQSL
ncbi:rho GTPase-activating protein 5-like [Canna indica]|uniref:Rho GTPase-activating protein 5-like n=1 Tax=Canna indica TaxID=4628 RepID=A0AAQ3K171_9LILI|nr:rho GTPase-activating protein 5-like [Canna indica]